MTPAEKIMEQIAILTEAQEHLARAIDDITGLVNPDEATWYDACRLSHLVDAVKRAELVEC